MIGIIISKNDDNCPLKGGSQNRILGDNKKLTFLIVGMTFLIGITVLRNHPIRALDAVSETEFSPWTENGNPIDDKCPVPSKIVPNNLQLFSHIHSG